MPINYTVIEDEDQSAVRPVLDLLAKKAPALRFAVIKPAPFDEQVKQLVAKIPDGILLDLRLDQKPGESGRRVQYRAVSLAQELRTRMAEGVLTGFPIALWSIASKFKRSYRPDSTSHDLFDAVYDKSPDDPSQVASQLVALAEGYRMLRDCADSALTGALETVLSLEDEEFDKFDPRIGQQFATRQKYPSYQYARFILAELFGGPGPLIDEDYLAARLGVDAPASKDWALVIERLKKKGACFSGPFSSGWSRWWMHRVSAWWATLSDEELRRLCAEARVDVLKKKLGLAHLVAAVPIEPGYGTTFWAVCRATSRAIEPADGVQIQEEFRPSWREPQFVSLSAVLSREANQAGISIHPSERPRIREIRRYRHSGS